MRQIFRIICWVFGHKEAKGSWLTIPKYDCQRCSKENVFSD